MKGIEQIQNKNNKYVGSRLKKTKYITDKENL